MNALPRLLAQTAPAIHLIDTEYDSLCDLALRIEHRHPNTAKLLLAELERAELHDAADLPPGTVRMQSRVAFVDEANGAERTVQLVYPSEADLAVGKLSVLTPVGAGLIGLSAGSAIVWPDREGHRRRLRIVTVAPLDDGSQRD